MRLCLVIATLSGGGAERVMTSLANAWADRADEVYLVTLDAVGAEAYPLSPAVYRIGLDMMGASRGPLAKVAGNVNRIARLRSTFRSLAPDVIISFMTSTNVLTVLAARSLQCPVVLSERNAPDRQEIGLIWRVLRRLILSRANAVVVQTQSIADWVRRRMPKTRVCVIANPVAKAVAQTPDRVAGTVLTACADKSIVLAIGRLRKQKGFDLLLRAYASTARDLSETVLVILGEGPERARLETLARELKIEDRIMLPGFSDKPRILMAHASVFVLSSRYEGMPNVLLEAMASGAAVVSFDCPTGPGELIEHGDNGLLVEAGDVSALAMALARVMTDDALRARLAQAAQRRAECYSPDRILAQWDTVFHDVGV